MVFSLKEQKISSRYPQISKGYEEYTLLKDAYQNFEKHKKIARITFPLWLYVAVSGVLVYIMISPYY